VRILVTGAFGYVGGRVARALRLHGHELVLAGRAIPAWAPESFPGAALRRVDVLDASQVAAATRGVDAVAHLAALNERESAADPALAIRVREIGTRTVLRAAMSAPVTRVVFFSTFHVYKPDTGRVIDEASPIGPIAAYGAAHVAGERACREADRELDRPLAVILRISNVYGAPVHTAVDRWTLAHNDFCLQAVRSRKIVLQGPGSRQRDLVWVEDVAQATQVVLAADQTRLVDPTFNVGGGTTMAIAELAEVVRDRAEQLLGVPIVVESPGGPEDGGRFVYSIQRLRGLGYEPRDALVRETDALIEMLRAGSA
jgi:UDP-glucose 4-epimerase